MPADAPAGCAICHFKAGLNVPPAVIDAPEFVEEIEYRLAEMLVEQNVFPAPQYRLHGPAPPNAAAC
ncbi:MAG: hypothetical protein AAGH99_00820 [Planctomycetota bacterium]